MPSRDEAKLYTSQLGEPAIDEEKMLWMATTHDLPGAISLYADMFSRGILPLSFCLWVFEKRTGKPVA